MKLNNVMLLAKPVHEQGRRMNVLIISTSPRAGGNTDLLCDQVARGAAEAGAAVEKVSLRELKISPCTECGVCERTGECAINDDMQPLGRASFA